PCPVGGMDRQGDLTQELDLAFQAEAAPDLGEAWAVDELHGDVGPPGHLARRVDPADVRMVDPRLGPRLAQEALVGRRIFAVEELERDRPAESRVEGPV